MTKKSRLLQIITEKSLKTGNFTLASGATSTFLFDLKNTLLDPEGANLAADLILEILPPDTTAIGGLELGACPIVSAVCVKSFLINRPLKAFYVRKEQKDRGSKRLIEGCELTANDKVVILEDVTTTGGSALNAIKSIAHTGCKTIKILSIVDRQEGATANLTTHNIPLDSLFVRGDFI